ncbi:hypothetical protein JMJ78_0013617 [Colletotrichum scovillei]|nr:hypothetical protein JMJ78_0013617 [Colletotrichum scovillei]
MGTLPQRSGALVARGKASILEAHLKSRPDGASRTSRAADGNWNGSSSAFPPEVSLQVGQERSMADNWSLCLHPVDQEPWRHWQ